MKIEVGKRYTRGDGGVTGALKIYTHNTIYLQDPKTGNLYIKENGERYRDSSYSEKLVMEFVDVNKDTLFVKAPTKKQLVGGINKAPKELNFAYISVVNDLDKYVDIVIGAPYASRCASNFDKKTLATLIEELQAIHDVME